MNCSIQKAQHQRRPYKTIICPFFGNLKPTSKHSFVSSGIQVFFDLIFLVLLNSFFKLLYAFVIYQGFQRQLDWIQSSLLKTCAAHLGTYDGRNFYNPIACLNLKKKVSCPIVPWTEVEATGLRSNRFFCLLQKLGLLPISREAGFYPCIPHNWSPNVMFRVALIFGPIDQTMVDFDISLVTNETEQSLPHSLLRKSAAHYLSG
jgi:hypothetical protein